MFLATAVLAVGWAAVLWDTEPGLAPVWNWQRNGVQPANCAVIAAARG